MLFHEIYGVYYQTVAKILSAAAEGVLTAERMNRIARECAFSESFLTIVPALESGRWPLIRNDYTTPVRHVPSMPITLLEKRWLKAVSLDERIKLFNVSMDGLEDVEPLFRPQDYVVFDRFSDGDPYGDAKYVERFHTILDAIHTNRPLCIDYTNRRGGVNRIVCAPVKLEYSEKDDKFRLITSCRPYAKTVNLGRMISCTVVENQKNMHLQPTMPSKRQLELDLYDDRKALERALLHFAHFEKRVEQTAENRYHVVLFYESEDETELVIRVLSFGPMIRVTGPERFVNLIRQRLELQKSCALR